MSGTEWLRATEIGREEFAGTLDGQDTKFDTTYTFTGIFSVGSCPEPNAEREVVGGCIHYISGDGLVGVMRFYDVMYGDGAPHYFYEGTLAKSEELKVTKTGPAPNKRYGPR